MIAVYPAKPYLLVRWVRRRAFHERNLKRITKWPDQLRTVPGKYRTTRSTSRADDRRRRARDDGFFDGYGPTATTSSQRRGNELIARST